MYCRGVWRLLGIVLEVNRQMDKSANEARYLKLKFSVFRKYGKRCRCCGENKLIFLTMDHINNDGAEHRAKIGQSSDKLYRAIRKEGFPKDRYQILCWNCNWGKRKFGECPHTLFKSKEA